MQHSPPLRAQPAASAGLGCVADVREAGSVRATRLMLTTHMHTPRHHPCRIGDVCVSPLAVNWVSLGS